MSRISYHRMKTVMLVMPLLLLLAFFLVGCGNSTSSTTTGQTSATTTTPSPTNDATNVKNSDQQAQHLLQSLDSAQKDANAASASGDQQDTNQQP